MSGAICFVLALILWIYYIGRYSVEKSQVKKLDAVREAKYTRADAFIARTTDENLEKEINKFLGDWTNDKYADYRKELRETWDIYSDDPYPGYEYYPKTKDPDELIPIGEDCKRILMANRGKLPSFIATFGITDPYTSDERRVRVARFALGMNKQLMRHGVSEALMITGYSKTPSLVLSNENDPHWKENQYFCIMWAPRVL